MKIEFYRSKISKIDNYTELYRRCFQNFPKERNQTYFKWLYGKNPLGEYIGIDAVDIKKGLHIGQVGGIPFEFNYCGKKIKVFFMNSLTFDESNFLNKMDLIFIDGGHTFSIIKNDSEKAFKMIKSKGVILWHDYNPGKNSSKDVVRYLNSISKNKEIFKIKNTSLCFYQKD